MSKPIEKMRKAELIELVERLQRDLGRVAETQARYCGSLYNLGAAVNPTTPEAFDAVRNELANQLDVSLPEGAHYNEDWNARINQLVDVCNQDALPLVETVWVTGTYSNFDGCNIETIHVATKAETERNWGRV